VAAKDLYLNGKDHIRNNRTPLTFITENLPVFDPQGRRHVWRRELEDHRAREAGREQNMAAFTGAVGI